MSAIRKAMKGLEGPAREAMEKKLAAAGERMPPPLPAIYSVANNYSKVTPIHLLARGEYARPGAPSG
jgi:hypothetical protein